MELGGQGTSGQVAERLVSNSRSTGGAGKRPNGVAARVKGRSLKESDAPSGAGRNEATPPEPDITTDLRLRPRAGIDRVLTRVEFLPEHERALIEAVYRNGTPVVRLARMSGPASRARPLRRSIRLIVKRMLSDRFVSMARCVSRGVAGRWPRTRRRVGELLYLEGKTLRQAARELGLSIHVVRLHRGAIEAIFESEGR